MRNRGQGWGKGKVFFLVFVFGLVLDDHDHGGTLWGTGGTLWGTGGTLWGTGIVHY